MKAGLFNQVKVYPNLNILKRYQVKEFEEMKKESSDRVIVVSGYEGSGKSYMQLELHEHWTMEILGETNPEIAFSSFCFQDLDWAKCLVESKEKEYMMITHDEAINILYRKEGATKVNKEINKASKKFRGKKWYHTWLIPQVHRMDKEMVEDRVRRLLFVFKHNGKRYVAIYPKKRLDSLISEINRMIESTAKDIESRPQVLNCKTNPAFICRIPEYKGRFLKYYGAKKENNMDDSVDRVLEVISGKLNKQVRVTPKSLLRDKAMRMLSKGKTQKEVADGLDIGLRTLQNWIYEERDKQKV